MCRILAAMINRWLAGTAVLVGLVACSSSGGSSFTQPATSPAPTRPTGETVQTYHPPATHLTAAQKNARTCDQVHAYIVSTVIPTFDKWHVHVDEFNQKVGRELRKEATHMFTLSARASGAVRAALSHEATALTNISIAIEQRSDPQVGAAANRGNTAVAEIRGVCNF